MGSEKKHHKSLKDLFRSPSPHHLSRSSQTGNGPSGEQNGGNSHRSFLRDRDTPSSLTAHSSANSLHSTGGHTSGSEAATVSSEVHQSDNESTHSSTSAPADESKHPFKKRRERRHHSGSHLSLKRFFKILHPKEQSDGQKYKSHPQLPANTSKLAEKYDLGRLIGTGASGSVNLISDKHDSTKIYALKKFRNKLSGESDQDYLRKVKNEFSVGEHLRQQNLIHTMELFQEASPNTNATEFYIVMEYCPYDFFNLVMSGLMRLDEISCYLRQIVNGVYCLHQSGIAHRDLKLDNCVVDKNGVLKLIDFGSAFQFKKAKDSNDPVNEKSDQILYARGVVGSDPYLAPEVLSPVHEDGYDARLADVWSIAIIYCCMVLKRFPWKLPRTADPSYRAFAGLNSSDEPLSEEQMLETMTKELSVGKEAIPKYGPGRLLKILPPPSRNLIGRMLEIDVEKRAYMSEVIEESFIKSIDYCHYAAKEQAKESGVEDGTSNELAASESLSSETTKITENSQSVPVASSQDFIKATNHKHHLITEEQLEKINAEKERAKRAKEAGMA